MMPQTRPPLVHICPLPPQRNGIADYAAAILERLAPHYELICVVAAPEAVDPFFHDIARVISFEEYHRIADRLAGERHLSHIGNNDDHVPILDVLSREPLLENAAFWEIAHRARIVERLVLAVHDDGVGAGVSHGAHARRAARRRGRTNAPAGRRRLR
mgnify:CR=1 FL=1